MGNNSSVVKRRPGDENSPDPNEVYPDLPAKNAENKGRQLPETPKVTAPNSEPGPIAGARLRLRLVNMDTPCDPKVLRLDNKRSVNDIDGIGSSRDASNSPQRHPANEHRMEPKYSETWNPSKPGFYKPVLGRNRRTPDLLTIEDVPSVPVEFPGDADDIPGSPVSGAPSPPTLLPTTDSPVRPPPRWGSPSPKSNKQFQELAATLPPRQEGDDVETGLDSGLSVSGSSRSPASVKFLSGRNGTDNNAVTALYGAAGQRGRPRPGPPPIGFSTAEPKRERRRLLDPQDEPHLHYGTTIIGLGATTVVFASFALGRFLYKRFRAPRKLELAHSDCENPQETRTGVG